MIGAATLDRLVEEADQLRRRCGVPAAALAVADADGPVLARAFGHRRLDPAEAADADTRFAIGSCTKAFTATVIAQLADGGALDWETPVRALLPEFALRDPTASALATLTDLCCHRTGVPAHDLVWYNAAASQAELVTRLRHLEPSVPFRSEFQYSNLMYMAVGLAAARVAGRPWADLVREGILQPLGMRRALASAADLEADANWARPYAQGPERLHEAALYRSREGRPSGSLLASAGDMAAWLSCQIRQARGTAEGLVSPAQARRLLAPRILQPGADAIPEAPIAAYALGWSVGTYRGHLRVGHGGGVRGYLAQVSVLPEHGVGVAVLTNADGHVLAPALAHTAIDRLLGLAPIDWVRRLDAMRSRFTLAQSPGRPRVVGTSPSHDLGAYAGTYVHPAYGDLAVERAGAAGLGMTFHALPIALTHHHFDQFHAVGDVVDTFATFHTGPDGTVSAVSLRLEPHPAVAEIRFVRAA